ncbi:hypothetical protein SAMN05443253_106115 [Bacillus sp. OK048]|nr:hypothetical protein SAMN05443253_106115 [Bacillus sp. OK048]
MAETYRKSKVENLHSLIKIFLDQTNEKYSSQRHISDRNYLSGQSDAYKLVLKIIEKDFGIPFEEK